MKTVITLEENKQPQVVFQRGSITRNFTLTIDSLLDALHKSFVDIDIEEPKEKEVVVTISRALPQNTVKYAQTSRGREVVFISQPAQQYDVKYHDTVFKDVGFPNLLFVITVDNDRVIGKRVFCYKDRFVRDETVLYEYPYANVFPDGGMCFYPGDPAIKDLVQLQTWPNLWRTADMNDHLYNPKRTKLDVALRELLQTFEGKPFDHEILNSIYMKVEELSARIT